MECLEGKDLAHASSEPVHCFQGRGCCQREYNQSTQNTPGQLAHVKKGDSY